MLILPLRWSTLNHMRIKTRYANHRQRSMEDQILEKRLKQLEKEKKIAQVSAKVRDRKRVKRWKADNPDKVAAQNARYYAKKTAPLVIIVKESELQAPIEEPAIQPVNEYPTTPEGWDQYWLERGVNAPKPPDVVDNG